MYSMKTKDTKRNKREKIISNKSVPNRVTKNRIFAEKKGKGGEEIARSGLKRKLSLRSGKHCEKFNSGKSWAGVPRRNC